MAAQSQSEREGAKSPLVIFGYVLMAVGVLPFIQGGSLRWMGVFCLLQGVTCWLVAGATPEGAPEFTNLSCL